MQSTPTTHDTSHTILVFTPTTQSTTRILEFILMALVIQVKVTQCITCSIITVAVTVSIIIKGDQLWTSEDMSSEVHIGKIYQRVLMRYWAGIRTG